MIKVYMCTEFPEIYRHAYWGSFDGSGKDSAAEPVILENRNAFVKTNGIVKYWGCTQATMPFFCGSNWLASYSSKDHEIDHPEGYLGADGRIWLVCHNYNGTPPADLGMKEHAPMYLTRNCRTFVREFASKHECRMFFKALRKKYGKKFYGY